MDPLSIATLGLAGLATFGGMYSADKNAKLQRDIANANLQYQYWNANKQREMFNQSLSQQRNMQEVQNAFNAQQTWDMWNANNEYNSPQNQLNRVIAAGLNPMTVAGASPVAAQTSPASAGAGVSPVAVPNIQAPHLDSYKDPSAAVFDSLNGAASQIKDLSIAMNQRSQSNSTNRKLEFEIDRIVSETRKLDEEQQALQISNEIQGLYGKKKMSADLAFTIAKFGETLAHRNTLIAQGDWYNAQEYTEQVKSAYYELKNMSESKHVKWLDKLYDLQIRKGNQEIKELQSRIGLNYSNIKLNDEQENYLKSLQDLNYYEKGLRENELFISDSTVQNQIQKVMSDALHSFYGSQTERAKAQWLYEKWIEAKKDNDNYYMRFWLDQFHKTVGDAVEVGGAIATRGGSLFARPSQHRKTTSKRMNAQGYPETKIWDEYGDDLW